MDLRRSPDAGALLEEEPISPAPQVHGRMAAMMGRQPAPQLVNPQQPMRMQQPSPAPMQAMVPNAGMLGQPAPRQAPARPAAPPPMTFAEQEQAYRQAMRSQFSEMPEDEFEQHVQYGIAKQRGRMGAAQSKLLSKPMALYWSAVQKRDEAQLSHEQMDERFKHKRFEYQLPDKRMHQDWVPYQDRLDASGLKADRYGQRVTALRAELNKLGVSNKDLANPVTIHEYMRSLASSDPSHADTFQDDTDMLDDEP